MAAVSTAMRAKPTLSQLNQSLVGLKAAELKTLCLACGLPISGTKDVLTTRLEQSFLMNHERPRVDPTRRRILSVDMGVKNMAFALMSPGGPLLSAAPLTPAKELAFKNGSPHRQAPRIVLEAWRRLDLSADPAVQKSEADSWAPRSMAFMAYKVVHEYLLPLNPTHVVLERQRWRTHGSAAIQEWTMRVNSLEAMIHATLRTMKELGHWSGDVVSVSPDRVAPFWIGTPADQAHDIEPQKPLESVHEYQARARRATNRTATKKTKMIDVVGNMLQAESLIRPSPASPNDSVQRVMKLFSDRWRGVRRKRGAERLEEAEAGSSKIDDMADCLLQGMAYLKWEENKRLLQEQGVDVILKQAEQDPVVGYYRWFGAGKAPKPDSGS